MFLRSTLVSSDHNPDGFKTNSLFDPGGAENQSEKPLYTFDHTAHLGLFTESYALQRHGALWLDYIYTMEEPPEATRSTGSERSAGSQGQQEELKEDSTLRFIVGPLQLILSSSSIQRMQKFYSCVYNHDYEPYMKPLPGNTNSNSEWFTVSYLYDFNSLAPGRFGNDFEIITFKLITQNCGLSIRC